MDDNAFGAVIWVMISIGGLVVAGGATIGIMYATDYDVGATITATNCNITGASTVDVKTEWFGVDTSVELDYDQCQIIDVGNFVRYHIQSERTIIFASEGGACLWDTGKTPSTPC